MQSRSDLYLHEEVLLLALKDEKGTVAMNMVEFALAGAAVAELLLRKRIAVQDAKKKLLAVVDPKPVGEAVLDECLAKIQGAKRRARAKDWVRRLARIKNLKHRVALGLCRRGILRADEDKILLLFTRKIYPEVDPRPERALIGRLRKAIFEDGEDVDARTAVLVSLAAGARLLGEAFDKKALRSRKKRIESITKGEVSGRATREAIEAMQAAVLVAVVFPAVAASTASH